MEFNINLEQDIQEVSKEIDAVNKEIQEDIKLKKESGSLRTTCSMELTDKRLTLETKYKELVGQRDEQLGAILTTIQDTMCKTDKIVSMAQPYIDRINALYVDAKDDKYSAAYKQSIMLEINKYLDEMEDELKGNLKDKQRAITKAYKDYRCMTNVKAKDVSPTEIMLLKEEMSIMTDDEIAQFHANNRGNEAIRRLCEVEMKRKGIRELPDISPVADIVNTWADSINGKHITGKSMPGIALFVPTSTGVEPCWISKTDLRKTLEQGKLQSLQTVIDKAYGDLAKQKQDAEIFQDKLINGAGIKADE